MIDIPVSEADHCGCCGRVAIEHARPLLLGRAIVKGSAVYLCGRCWTRLGRPPAVPSGLAGKEREIAVFNQEQETRRDMMKRGGTAKHLVNKGIS